MQARIMPQHIHKNLDRNAIDAYVVRYLCFRNGTFCGIKMRLDFIYLSPNILFYIDK